MNPSWKTVQAGADFAARAAQMAFTGQGNQRRLRNEL
jgi:hypothetical protein